MLPNMIATKEIPTHSIRIPLIGKIMSHSRYNHTRDSLRGLGMSKMEGHSHHSHNIAGTIYHLEPVINSINHYYSIVRSIPMRPLNQIANPDGLPHMLDTTYRVDYKK